MRKSGISYLILSEKERTKMRVKFWFIRKSFDGMQRELAELVEPVVVKKSERAALLEWDIPGRGGFRRWVPMAAIEAV